MVNFWRRSVLPEVAICRQHILERDGYNSFLGNRNFPEELGFWLSVCLAFASPHSGEKDRCYLVGNIKPLLSTRSSLCQLWGSVSLQIQDIGPCQPLLSHVSSTGNTLSLRKLLPPWSTPWSTVTGREFRLQVVSLNLMLRPIIFQYFWDLWPWCHFYIAFQPNPA